jgi:hypothetical protein
MKVFIPLLVLIQCVKQIVSGVLHPEVPDSVLPYRNNEQALGKYTFSFKMSSPVPSYPRITIDFPSIYSKLLKNVDNCQGTVEVKLINEKQTFTCTLVGNQFIFDLSSQWSELDSGNIVVEIFDIINPSSVALQSTGYFQMRTWSGIDIVIDSNLAFDSIGFAPAYTLFAAASLVNDGSNIAGYTTNYILTFTTAFTYPKGTWFRMNFASGFGFESALDCYITNIAVASSNLPCYNDGSVLIMKNLLADLPAGTYKIKMRNIINPKIATPASGTFLFESMKEGVNTVMEYTDTIAGMVINPGTITDVSVIGFPLVQNLYVDYTITYKPANSVAKGGMFRIVFPPDFVGGIDTSCRVIYGLLPADETGLKCTTNGIRDITITNFQDFTPQYVQVKCYAYNPPVGGETQNFQVRTFTTPAATQVIDENPQAGTVVISEIQKPNFMKIDFYKLHVNCSFYQMCPINFRYFPYPNQTLSKATSTTDFSAINMQMPIWWLMMNGGNNGTYPECLFEAEPTASCHQHMHVVSLITPTTQPYGSCEPPVTINSVQVSPIPGKFPFRIWAFNNGTKYHNRNGYTQNWYQTPFEQDTYIMDISVTGIAVLQTWTASNDLGDSDNLLHLRSNVHPFLFAWSGTVSVVITHVENSLEDKAEWSRYAGQALVTDNSFKEVACKLYQSSAPTGYLASWWSSRDLRCQMKTGDYSVKDPTTIQVVGFDSNIDKGNYYEMFIPDMQYCLTVNRQCKILYTYTMTEDIAFPYRVSQREQSLGIVNPAPTGAATQNTAVVSTWTRPARSSNRRCDGMNLYVYARPDRTFYAGDYMMVKRNIDHWYLPFFRNNNYGLDIPALGYTGVWYPVLNFEKNQEYLIHRFTSTVAMTGAATEYQVRVQNLITSIYPNDGAWIDLYMWPAHTKRTAGRLQITTNTNLNDGFAISAQNKQDLFGGLPWTHTFWWQPTYVDFRICAGVPEGGQILLDYQTNNGPLTAPTPATQDPLVCRVWNTVRFQKANNSEVSCVFDSANDRWSITNFWTILPRTQLRVNWYTTYGASMSTTNFKGETYNVSGNAATMMDYYSNNANWRNDANGVGQTKALMWNFLGHHEYKWELYQGSSGKFVFEIETGDNMIWEPTESYQFRFTISNTVAINNGRLECRYALKNTITGQFGHHYPSVECGLLTAGATTNTYYMKLHPYLDIAANSRYQIFLDTRATDTNDGLTFNQYGIYTINVESYNGGTKLKGGKQRYEVYGPWIPHFYVWSSNKIFSEKAFYSYYVDFINTQTIANSDPSLATYHTIYLYFATNAPGGGGYPIDLGTGYPDQSIIPCNIIETVPLWVNVNTPKCTLLYGYSNAPTKIKVEGFTAFTTRVFRVDIPVVQNPGVPGVVPRTWLKIFSTTGAGAAKTSTVIWEGHYYELNTTWARNTTRYPYSANTLANTITMPSVAQREGVTGNLIIPFISPQTLHGRDFVLIKFPIFWPTPWSITNPAFCAGMPLSQQRCFSIRNDEQDAHYLYFEISGAMASGATLTFTVPSSRAVMPIANATTDVFTMFIYHDTRLIATQTYTTFPSPMFIPDPIVPAITCNPTSALQNSLNDYIVRFTLPHDLLGKSEIRIDYVDYDLSPDLNCTSTTNSALTGSVSCSMVSAVAATPVVGPYSYASVVNFDPILRNSQVEIKLPLLNRLPAVPATRKWQVRTYYLRDGYYYLAGDSGLVNHVASCNVVATPAVTNVPWATWFHKFQRTRYNSYGPLVFYFESAYTLTMNTITDYIEVTIPTSFQFQKAEKVASWGMHYPFQWDFQVVGANHQIRIWPPKTLDITAGTRYMVNITTLNALNDINGLLYPDQTASPYIATIKVVKGGVAVEQGDAKIFAFKPSFPLWEAKSYLINSNQKAAFSMKFTIGTAYTYSAGNLMMIFRIPTTTYIYRQRVNLFADDAGTGLTDGSTINCQLINPALALQNTACRFYKGSQDNGIPARVEMYAGSALSLAISTTYTVVFDGFKHPATGDDDKNVEPSLEFYTPAGAWIYTGVDYDYTIVEDSTYPPLALTAPTAPRWDSPTIGQTNIGVEMEFTSPVALSKYQPANGLGWADYLILEFPVGYVVSYNTNSKAKLTAGTGFAASVDTPVEFACGNNWIIWRPNIATIAANTQYTLRFSNVDQAKTLPPNPVFRMLIVQDREIKRIMTYPALTSLAATAILTTDITFDSVDMPTLAVPAQTIPRNKYQMWSLTFKHPAAAIPLGGAIQIVLPAGVFTNMDAHCYNQPTSSLVVDPTSDTIYCTWDTATNSYIITNFNTSPVTDTVKIWFYANSQTASPGVTTAITIRAYKDTARTYQLLQGTINTLVSNSKYGFNQLVFNQAQDEIPDVVRAGESSEFDFEMKIPTTYNTGTTLTLTFAAGVSVPAGAYLECFFNQIEARECTVTSTAPLTIQILAPHSPALTAGTQYKIKLRSRCSASNQKGLIFATAGTFSMTVTDGISTVSIPYEVFKPNFNWIWPRVMHSNQATNNAIAFRMELTVAVPATGLIRIKFPRMTHSGKYLLWNSLYQPGTAINDNCVAVSPSDLVPTGSKLNCVYQEDNNHIMFVISGFNAMAIANQPEVVLYNIMNTATTIDNLQVDAVIQTEDGLGTILNQGVIFDVLAFMNAGTVTTSSPGTSYTRTGNSLGQTGVSYTFPSIPFGVTGYGPNDQIVFEFTSNYYFGSTNYVSGAVGTYKSYGKYVVFKPTATLTGAQTLTFGPSITNPTIADTSQINIYLVSSRGFTTLLKYNTPAWTASGTTTVTGPASSLLKNAGSKYTITVDTTFTIPAAGSIAFKFQTDYSIKAVSVNSGFPANSVVTFDNSVAGFVIAVVTTPTSYSKGVNGVAIFDVYVANPTTTKTLTVLGYKDYATSQVLFTQAAPAYPMTTTSAALTTCYFDTAPTYSVAASGSLGLSVLTPGAVAVTFNAGTNVGYDMVTSASGTAGCNGLPVYVLPATTLAGAPAITLYHWTLKKTGIPNAVKVTGDTPMIFDFAKGRIAVDFGNHDLNDLGYGLTNGSYVPCSLLVNAVATEALCTLDLGNFYKSPGVIVRFFANIASGATIDVVISKFHNPTTARNVEVRFRYFETYYGQRTLDLVAYVQMFTVADSVVTTSTTVLALAPSSSQSTVATATFALTATENGLDGLVFGPGLLNNKIGQASVASVDESYPEAAFNYDSAIAGAGITTTTLAMPSSSTGASTWTVVVLDPVTRLVSVLKTFTGTTVSTCTLTSITFTALSKNDVTGVSSYSLAWTSPCDFPRTSTIRISIAAYLTSASVLSATLASGTITGSYSVTFDSTYIYITGYDYIAAGSIQFNMNIYATYNAPGSTSGIFQVLHNGQSIVSATPTCAKVTTAATLTATKYRDYVRYDKPITISGKGYISLLFKPVSAFAATDVLYLVQSSATFATNAYLRCKFSIVGQTDESYLAESCYFDSVNKWFYIKMPKSTLLVNTNVYRLDIFYAYDQFFGFAYPGTSTDIAFTVRLQNGATIKDEFVSTLQLAKGVPTATCFRNFVSNTALKNVFTFRFNPSATITAATGTVEFQFPGTVVSQGTVYSAFNRNLGMSIYNNQAVQCKAFTVAGSTKTDVTSSLITKCVVDYGGDSNIHRYAKVKPILASSLNAGTVYQFDIYGIDNPTVTDIMSQVRMVAAENPSAGVYNYMISYDGFQLYTVTPTAATTETTVAMPAIAPTTIQSLTNIALNVNTAASISIPQDIAHVRLVYNLKMRNTLTTPKLSATNFETFDVTDATYGLAYFYTQVTTATNFVLSTSNFLTPTSAEPFVSSFQAQIIAQKVVKKIVPYSSTTTFVAPPWTSVTVPVAYKTVKANDKTVMQVDLTFSKILTKTGSIELYLKNMASIDPTCNELTTIVGANFKCEVVSGTTLRISGFSRDVQVAEKITLNFRVTTSAAAPAGQVCATAFNDYPAVPTAQTMPVQTEVCDTLTYTTYPGIVWFEARTPTMIRRVQASERAMMTHQFDATTLVPMMNGKVRLLDTGSNFANIETRDFLCFFTNKTDYVAKSCIYYAATKYWEIYAPRVHGLTGWYTLTVVPHRQQIEFARLEGVQMPVAGGSYPLSLQGLNAANAVLFTAPELNVNLPVRHYTTFAFNSYLVMNDAFSTFHLKIRPSVAIPATPNGVIKIDFKIKDQYNLDIFNSDLGTGILNGAAYSCPSATGGLVTNCRLFLGNANTPASILVDPSVTMAVGTTYDIDFPALLNPVLNMSEVLMEISSQQLVAAVWTNLNTKHHDVFVAQEIIVVPTPMPALTWSDNRSGAPCSVNFAFTMNPAYGDLKSSLTSFDRIVITVDKPVLDILNDQAVGALQLACAGYSIKIFDSKDIIELSTTVGITAGSAVNIACTNYFNQQYVIRGGVSYTVQLWIDGTIAEAFQYPANVINPHPVTTKNVAISAITPEITSFDTYTFTVKPFNYMPVGSRFEIYFDQSFSGITNCEIISGLNGGICQIVEDDAGFDRIKISKYQLWNPLVDPQIVIRADMNSPAVAGPYDFNFVSYWLEDTVTPANEDKIDEDILGTINFLRLRAVPLPGSGPDVPVGRRERCPHGRTAKESSSSRSRLLRITHYPNYLMVDRWRFTGWDNWERSNVRPFILGETLCYFDFDDILFSAKSERCFWAKRWEATPTL